MKTIVPALLLALTAGLSHAQAPFDGTRLVPLLAHYETVLGPGSDGSAGQTITAWHLLHPAVRDGNLVWEQMSVSQSGDDLFGVDVDVWEHPSLNQVFRRVTRGETITQTERHGNKAVRGRTGSEPLEVDVDGIIVSNGLFNYVGLGTLPLAEGWTGSYRSFAGQGTVRSHRLDVVGLREEAGQPVWEVTATTTRSDGRTAVTRWFVQEAFPRVVTRMEAETADGRTIAVKLLDVHVMDR